MGVIGTPRHNNLLGQRFGRLTVIAESSERSAGRGMRWVCKCDCGTIKTIDAAALRRGATVSCGCYNLEYLRNNIKHGYNRHEKKDPTYTSWEKMLERCYRPTGAGYDRYGGRGITVCERWHDFKNFLEDMGERPGKEYTLDRIDSNGNYEPGNCRWADWETQNNNTRRNVYYEYNGQKLTISQLAKIAGVKYDTMYGRLVTTKMTIEDAMTRPLSHKSYRRKVYKKKQTI